MVIKYNKFYSFLLGFAIVITSLFVFVSSDKTVTTSAEVNSLKLPIIMYHHMSENPSKANKYTVTTSEFESDLNYIKKMGYTTVTMNEVIDYVEGKIQLPEKVIVITFDDGFYSTYSLALPLLEKYKMKAVVSVIGSVTQTYTDTIDHNVNYANLNWQEISDLDKTEEIEIQNHTYNMHYNENGKRKGIMRLNGESSEQYEKALIDDLGKMQNILKEKAQVNATTMTYPYGVYSSETLKIVKELGFKANLLCEQRVNIVKVGDENSLYNLGRYNRDSGLTSKQFFKEILS